MEQTDETTPDELLDTFRGRSMKSIVIFTLAVHAVVITLTSLPFLWRTVAGDSAKMSEEERVQAAVREATASLRQIAEQHGMRPQELSDQIGVGTPVRAPRPAADAEPTGDSPAPSPDASTPVSEEPKSAIEQELEKAEPGPTVPPIPDEEEDLFK